MSKRPGQDLPIFTRRRLLTALAMTPFASAYGRDGMLKMIDMIMGSQAAYAAPGAVKYFIEINLRDQWDFMHFVVPPGLATAKGLIRANEGKKGEEQLCALFQDPASLTKGSGNFYLTDDSKELLPHLGEMAMVDTVELCIGGIHGHEAANGLRSPGRGYNKGDGRLAMWLNDDPNQTDAGGDEFLYSSSPTPAIVHLNVARESNPAARAVALKFLGRSDKKHSVYHFAGKLSENGFLRVQSREQLVQAFVPAKVPDVLTKDEMNILGSMLKKVDQSYLKQLKYTEQASKGHGEAQTSFHSRLTSTPPSLNFQLTDQEKDYWSKDVPPEMSGAPRMHLWEQCAIASKLIEANAVSTIAMEFSTDDLHGPRPRSAVRAMGGILGKCVARLVADLKAKNLWKDTLIMINSTDGGRSPLVDSYGDSGKNTMILLGPGIKGGYYGDIRVASTNGNVHSYSYHIPDFGSGATNNNGATDNKGRIPNAVAYRTILQAMGAPTSIYSGLPDVGTGQSLGFILKT